MPRLRHIALVVKDLEKAAHFYKSVFGFTQAGQETLEFASAIYLTDGTINLALLKYRGSRGHGLEDPTKFVGIHHFGIQVEDMGEAQKKIEDAGGTFFFDLGDDMEKENFERKFKDPDGIIFDVSVKGWIGTTTPKKVPA
jgi:catechol 2,3-dioxygenase-like lactoylglutathione lyase family enzyme